MKNKKIAAKQIRNFFVLISLAIFAYMYFVVYKDYETETRTLDQELTTVLQQTEERKNILSQGESLQANTMALQQEMEKYLMRYSSRLILSDALLFMYQFKEENKNIDVVGYNVDDIISFCDTTVPIRAQESSEVTEEQDTSVTEGSEVTDETTPSCMRGKRCDITISYSAKYEDLKACIKYIEDYPERITLDSISMAYDDTTGLLTGNMKLSLYAIEGNGVPEKPFELDDIPIGKENLFEN